MRKKSLLALLAASIALVLSTTLVFAGVHTFQAGNNDNFDTSDGLEPTSPSADLLLLMDPYGGGDRVQFPHRQFDDVHINRVFGHTFTDLPPCIVRATLEIRMFAGGSSLVSNDAIHLELTGINNGFGPWGMGLTALLGQPWIGGTDHTFILDLANLPPDAQGDTNIIPLMNADHALDVYVQDDTGVDYMVLTVETTLPVPGTTLCAVPVDIDIKPSSDPNSINTRSNGTIPVAILSTPDFDAPNEVDKTSLTFGRTGDEESLAKCTKSAEDVNGDGLLDVVCHFNTQDTGFQAGDTEGIVKGLTVDGVPIEGRDSVRIVR